MSQTIPTLADEPYYTIRARLDDQDYTLSFYYSTRAARYYVTLLDESNVRLCSVKLLPGVELLAPYRYRPGMPTGELVVICGGDGTPPEFGELGSGLRCELTYFPAAELAAATAAVNG
jgi:hypothetical protein